MIIPASFKDPQRWRIQVQFIYFNNSIDAQQVRKKRIIRSKIHFNGVNLHRDIRFLIGINNGIRIFFWVKVKPFTHSCQHFLPRYDQYIIPPSINRYENRYYKLIFPTQRQVAVPMHAIVVPVGAHQVPGRSDEQPILLQPQK